MVEVNIENLKTILKGKIAFKHSVASELEEDGEDEMVDGYYHETLILNQILTMISNEADFNNQFEHYSKEVK